MTLTKLHNRMVEGSVLNVVDFGAKGDGVNDDTAAIQAAINYAQDNLLPVYFPSNKVSQVYKTTAPLVVSKPLTMTGASSRNVTIAATGLTAGQFVLDIDGTAFGTYQNGKFSGFTLFADAGNCMRIKDVSLSEFDDIGLRNCVQGITYTGTRCFSNVFRRIELITALTGNTFTMASHTGGGHHSFYDCTFGGNTGFSIDSNTITDTVNFYSCNFEQCTTNSFFAGGAVSGLGFYGSRTEGCDGIDFQINPALAKSVTGLVIEGCAFSSSDAGGLSRISLGGSGGKVRGFNIVGNSVSHGANNFSAAFVTLNGEGESGTIANNFFDGLKTNCSPTNVLRTDVSIYNNEANDAKFDDSLMIAQGNWTPTDASGASLTFTSVSATYRRIGDLVTLQCSLTFPTTADTNPVKIGGLPISVNSGQWTGALNTNQAGAFNHVLIAFTGGDFVFLRNSSNANPTNANFSGKFINFSITYIVA
jgi:hypothetical protein